MHFQGFATTHKKAQTAQEHRHLADMTRTPGKGRAGRAWARRDGARGPILPPGCPGPCTPPGIAAGAEGSGTRAARVHLPGTWRERFGPGWWDFGCRSPAPCRFREAPAPRQPPAPGPLTRSAHNQLSGSLARQTSSPPSTSPDRKGILVFKQLLFLSFSCQLKFRSLTTGGKRYHCLEACPERLGASCLLPHGRDAISCPQPANPAAAAPPGLRGRRRSGNDQPPDKQTCNNSQHLFCQKINIPLALLSLTTLQHASML